MTTYYLYEIIVNVTEILEMAIFADVKSRKT